MVSLGMDLGKGNGEIAQKATEWTFKGACSANQDIFVACVCLLWSNLPHSSTQAPFYTVAHNSITKLFGRSEAETGCTFGDPHLFIIT